MIQCLKTNCNMRYIGETRRILKFRLAEHRGYVTSEDVSKATGEHFNSPGRCVSEKVRSTDDLYRKEREKYFIRKFNTFYKGLIDNPEEEKGEAVCNNLLFFLYHQSSSFCLLSSLMELCAHAAIYSSSASMLM